MSLRTNLLIKSHILAKGITSLMQEVIISSLIGWDSNNCWQNFFQFFHQYVVQVFFFFVRHYLNLLQQHSYFDYQFNELQNSLQQKPVMSFLLILFSYSESLAPNSVTKCPDFSITKPNNFTFFSCFLALHIPQHCSCA